MNLASQIPRIEKLLDAADGECNRQCPHTLRFLGQVLDCPSGGCWAACQLAKKIILHRVALMEAA
jgi:hypothetical protein